MPSFCITFVFVFFVVFLVCVNVGHAYGYLGFVNITVKLSASVWPRCELGLNGRQFLVKYLS